MSEKSPKKTDKKAEKKPAESKKSSSETKKEKPKSKPAAAKSSDSVPIKNGKGSGPRNLGPGFLNNYGKITWESDQKGRPKAGTKFVKKY